MKQLRHYALMLLAAVLAVPVAWAQETEEVGRGVARISVINGDVSVRRADTDDWIAAAVNAPLVVPDTLYTGTASRAEVQLDWANMVRMASNTEVQFTELEEDRFQIQLTRGMLTYSMLRESKADIDLATPNVSIRPLKKGRYRVAVLVDGTTEITVRSGQAEIYTPQGVEHLRSGKSMLVRGTLGNPEFQIVSASSKDQWDRWNEQRDKELRRSLAYNYVSPSVSGAEVLDGYGNWIHDSSHGWVWAPRVAVGWAPYRYGRWSWVDYYGWSWVSYDPWGWAPYHYGRWYNSPSYGWCWWPGARRARHHWSPGLVAFFGWGSHSGFHFGVSVGFGFGHVGWVPLAPYERYHRWYGRGYHGGRNRTYVDNRTYIDNSVNITNVYKNARHRNGITAVEGDRFGRGHVRNTYRGDSTVLRKANLVRGQVPVVPQSESRRLASRDVNRSNLPSRSARGNTFTRRNVTPATRASFSDQQRGVESLVRRTAGRGSATRAGQSVAGGNAPARRSSRAVGTSGQGSRASGASAQPANRSGRGGSSSSGLTSRGASASGQQAGSRRAPNAAPSRTQRSTRGDGAGWTSFGQPASPQRTARGSSAPSSASRSATRSAAPAASRSTRGNSGGWTRFGEPGRSSTPSAVTRSGNRGSTPTTSRSRGSSAATRGSSTNRSSSGWSRFDPNSRSGGGSRATSRSSTPSSSSRSTVRSAPSSSSRSTVRSAPSSSRSSRSASRSSSPSSSIRVRPSIVSPRSSSRSSSPRVFGGSSGSRSSGSVGRRSAPSPSRSPSPSMRRSAPSRSSGGGFSRPSSRSSSPSMRSAPSRSSGTSMRSAPSRSSGGGGRSSGSSRGSSGRGGRR